MSPILVRPVREQLEHDRVIRLLQAKYKRKYEVAINPGNIQAVPVGTPPSQWYPDLVLQSPDRGHKLLGVVEVETAESVNHLEAMSQWAAFSRLRAEFHLYVPAGSIDTSRRLCTDLQIDAAEIWAYSALGDQLRFTLVHRSPQASEAKARVSSAAPAARARVASARPAARPKRPAAPVAAPARRHPAAKLRASASKTSPRGVRVAVKAVKAGKVTKAGKATKIVPASRAQKKRK